MDVTLDQYKAWVAGAVNLACNLMSIICPDAEKDRAKAGGLDFKDRAVCSLAVWCCLEAAKEPPYMVTQEEAVKTIMDAVNEWEGEPGYLSKDFVSAILQQTEKKKF
jgi:hypothetical protein